MLSARKKAPVSQGFSSRLCCDQAFILGFLADAAFFAAMALAPPLVAALGAFFAAFLATGFATVFLAEAGAVFSVFLADFTGFLASAPSFDSAAAANSSAFIFAFFAAVGRLLARARRPLANSASARAAFMALDSAAKS